MLDYINVNVNVNIASRVNYTGYEKSITWNNSLNNLHLIVPKAHDINQLKSNEILKMAHNICKPRGKLLCMGVIFIFFNSRNFLKQVHIQLNFKYNPIDQSKSSNQIKPKISFI